MHNVANVVRHGVINYAFRKVYATRVKHEAAPKEAIVDIVQAEHPTDHKRHGREDLDPTAELAEQDAWILGAQDPEDEVKQEVNMHRVLVEHEPGVRPHRLDVMQVVDVEYKMDPADQVVDKVLVDQEVA